MGSPQITFDPNAVIGFLTANFTTFMIILQLIYVIVSIINLIKPKVIVIEK